MAAYSWFPKTDGKDFEHSSAILSKTGLRQNQFFVNPEWVSEEMHPRTPVGMRRYRPWPFEFQGARFYPWGGREKRWAEEAAARELVEAEEIIGERDPVTDEERDEERVRIFVQDTRGPWNRPPPQRPVSTAITSAIYSRHLPSIDLVQPGTNRLYDSVSHMSTQQEQYRRSASGLVKEKTLSQSGRAPYDPITYRSPYEEQLRARSMMLSKCATFQPRDGRPRFDRPYMNFANSMWMRYPPDVVF